MQPGIYEKITNKAYHDSEGISRSGIMAFMKSPLHYWDKYINPEKVIEEPTQSMIFGNALHTFILERKTFGNRFLTTENVDRRTKKGKEYWEKINELKNTLNGEREIITLEDFCKLQHIDKRIINHPGANKLIENSSYESSIYWNDPYTGILCKARPDIMCDTYIADIKTTDDASPEAFRYSIRKYGYHIQAAMLLDGMNAIKGTNCKNFIIIAAEKKPPYAVAVYVLDEAAIDIGREIYKSTLVEYKKCLEENNWPSYKTQTISI